MNYNFISQLLDNGISEEELIASISKSLPRLGKKASKMLFGGWSPKEVLNLFSKDKEAQQVTRKGLKPVTPSEMAAMHLQNSYNNIPQKFFPDVTGIWDPIRRFSIMFSSTGEPFFL